MVVCTVNFSWTTTSPIRWQSDGIIHVVTGSRYCYCEPVLHLFCVVIGFIGFKTGKASTGRPGNGGLWSITLSANTSRFLWLVSYYTIPVLLLQLGVPLRVWYHEGTLTLLWQKLLCIQYLLCTLVVPSTILQLAVARRYCDRRLRSQPCACKSCRVPS